ncbi:hypothetical protein MRB53_040313 [Persea americana]|nr:hypothetical protein MRB53_040313 [Persea americana]
MMKCLRDELSGPSGTEPPRRVVVSGLEGAGEASPRARKIGQRVGEWAGRWSRQHRDCNRWNHPEEGGSERRAKRRATGTAQQGDVDG